MCEHVYVSVCVCVCLSVCACMYIFDHFDHFLSVFPCNYVLVSVCTPACMDERTHMHACVHCSDYIRIIMESYHHHIVSMQCVHCNTSISAYHHENLV